MESISKEESFSAIKGLKTGLKTFVFCFVGIMFILASIFVLFPKMSLKINNALGFNKLKEKNYQMIYSRTDDIADLYNLILHEGEIKNFSKELEYIDEMIQREDFDSFCRAMDKASLEAVSDKNMIPYSVNVNGYLLSRKVICLYNLKLNGADTYVYRQTSTAKFTEYSFSTYVDLICDDKELTIEQKRERLSLFMDMFDVSGKTLSELIDIRIDNINNNLKLEQDKEKEISLLYTLTRIYRSRYYAYDILGDETKKNTNASEYENTKIKLNNLIENIW